MNHKSLIILIPTDHLGPSDLMILVMILVYTRHGCSPHRALDYRKHISHFCQSSHSPRNRDSYDHATTENFHRSSQHVPHSCSRSRSRQRSCSRQRSGSPSRSGSPPGCYARPSSFSPDSDPSEQDFEDSFLTSMTQRGKLVIPEVGKSLHFPPPSVKEVFVFPQRVFT